MNGVFQGVLAAADRTSSAAIVPTLGNPEVTCRAHRTPAHAFPSFPIHSTNSSLAHGSSIHPV